MHVILNTNTFKDILEMVGRVSTKHVTLPVLQCVLITVKDKKITLKATNLEIGIEALIEGEIKEEGVIAVPASILIQTVNLINQKEVSLRIEENSLIVEADGSETQIKSIPHEEFPTISKLNSKGQVIQNSLFSLGIKTTAFAASQSSIKPELGSIYIFQKKEHTLTFVTTDSFRLMEKTVPQKNITFDDSILIPYKNAIELSRICDLKNSDPVCKMNENQFSLEFEDGVYITSRLTTGTFPDYTQIIPKEYITHTTLLKDDFIHALRKTNIFLNKFFQVGLHVMKDSLAVHANSGDVGTTTESVKAVTKGDDITLNFNQKYLSEPLNHIGSESIVMHFAGIGRPMVIEGVDDTSLRYLVMPMNK